LAVVTSTTARFSLRYMQGNTTIRDIDSWSQTFASDIEAALNGLVPPGTIVGSARATMPTAYWLLCDGAAVSRTTYAALFTEIGTSWGAGNGTSTFNVPDGRGRCLVGADLTANRLSRNDALGQSGGEQDHDLVLAELVPHSHVLRSSAVSGGVVTEAANVIPNTDGHVRKAGANATNGETEDSTGAGNPFNVMQPHFTGSWFIRY
jgi:microcystin-dependent protein